MPNKNRRVTINAFERAVSTDLNDIQSMVGQSISETARTLSHMTNKVSSNLTYAGVSTTRTGLHSSTVYPAPHRVIEGMLVRIVSPTYLNVEAGSILQYSPAAMPGTWDSDYAIAHAPAMTSAVTLTYLGNGAGNTRVDIIECQMAEHVDSTASRDIYNDGTGTFTPTVVNKVEGAIVNYRIRRGTVGVQLALDPAWVPLAICLVYPTSTSFDTCDFYDVRYFASTPHIVSYSMGAFAIPEPSTANSATCTRTSGTDITVEGYLSFQFQGVRIGGPLWSNSCFTGVPGTDVDKVQIANTTDSISLDSTADHWNMLVCVMPLAFPTRFMRYSRANVSVQNEDVFTTTARLPRGSNGVWAHIAKSSLTTGTEFTRVGFIKPTTTLLPASMGFGSGAYAYGIVATEYPNVVTAGFVPFNVVGTHTEFMWGVSPNTTAMNPTPAANLGVIGMTSIPFATITSTTGFMYATATLNWNLTTYTGASVPSPVAAKYVDVLLQVTAPASSSGPAFYQALTGAGGAQGSQILATGPTLFRSGSEQVYARVRVPMLGALNEEDSGYPNALIVCISSSGTTLTAGSSMGGLAYIVGYGM